jgi:hypothetical protein
MKQKFLSILALLALPLASHATILTFDDVTGGSTQNTYGALGTYQGFNFSCTSCGSNRLDWIDTVGSSWNFGAVSGDFTLLNNYGGVGVITAADGSDFTFDGLYAETWANAPARSAYIRGFNNGLEIWTSAITLGSQFAYFGGVTGAIDELRLDFGNFFLVDNLALNEGQHSVPEPTSLSLLGLGFGLLAMSRRRKRKL